MVWISHTGVEKYLRCSASFNLHYNEKIRPTRIGSALHFGSAIDEAVNAIMLGKKKKLTKEEKVEAALDPIMVFEEKWFMPSSGETALVTDDNGNKVPVGECTNPNFEYYKSDFDASILDESDFKRLRDFIEISGYEKEDKSRPEPIELMKEFQDRITEAGRQISPNEVLTDPTDISYHNFCSWLSMRQKGLYFIKSFLKDIYPLIEEVKSVQRKVKLPNATGDIYNGKLDFELSYHEEPGVFYTTDYKTSSISTKYKQSDINEKPQIASYDVYTGNGKGSYIVQYKQIQDAKICSKCKIVSKNNRVKKCPEEIEGKRCNGEFEEKPLKYVKWDILKDDIEYSTKQRVFKDIDNVLKDVKTKIFHQNRDECYQFGRKCPYYFYCRSPEKNRDATTIPLKDKNKHFNVKIQVKE